MPFPMTMMIIIIIHFLFLGCTEPDQLLSLLVYTAAKEGAQQFLEMIFNTSSGRVVFDAHKKRSPLPEAIARENGHEETACYLEGITKRYILVLNVVL